jgi:hypothetical protein
MHVHIMHVDLKFLITIICNKGQYNIYQMLASPSTHKRYIGKPYKNKPTLTTYYTHTQMHLLAAAESLASSETFRQV